MSDSPSESGASTPQLKQLRDALERAIVSSLQLLDQLEAELAVVQTQEEIAQRKSKAAALIDIKKILEPLQLVQKPEVPLDTTIADAKVANFRKNIQSVIIECQLKLRGMRHVIPRLTDVSKGTSLARILSLVQKRLQGEKPEGMAGIEVAGTPAAAPASPVTSPSPSPSPQSSSSTSAANSPPSTGSLAPSESNGAGDFPLVLPGRKDSVVGRLSTPTPPSVQVSSPQLKPPRAISLESERESASRLVQQGQLQVNAAQHPDPHSTIPKQLPSDGPAPLQPQEGLRVGPNPLAPSSGPGMTPTPQTQPPVAPTPKSNLLSLSLNNLSKMTLESPPPSPDTVKPLPKPPSKTELVPSPRADFKNPSEFKNKPLPVAPQTLPTPRAAAPSAGPGGAPSGGPGEVKLSPRGDTTRNSEPMLLGLPEQGRSRAMSRSEGGITRPNSAISEATKPERPESLRSEKAADVATPPLASPTTPGGPSPTTTAPGTPTPATPEGSPAPVKLSRSGTRQALMLKKDDREVLPPTPRSRGKVELQEDINIWDEGPDSTSNLTSEKQADNTTNITGGTFNKLVEKLTSPNIETQDPLYTKIFYYTFQAWATPKSVLMKLIQRFAIPQRDNFPSGEEALAIQRRTCAVLKRWIELLQQDFNNEEMQVLASAFTEDMKRKAFAKEAEEIEALLAEKTIRLLRKDSSVLNWDAIVKNATQQPPPPKCVLSTKIYPDNLLGFLNIDDEEVARQLSLMDASNFAQIRPRELLGQAWARPEADKFAPNVLAHINHFNFVSQLCVHMIVHPETPKDRARMVTKWVAIMKHLRSLNNFSSLMAIVAGFNNSAVLRLKKTLVEVPAESLRQYQEYEALLKSEANYRTYREALRVSPPPCIPYLGVHVQDLTFMDENPDQVNGLINFHKNRLIYSAISELLRCQQVGYNFTILTALQHSLKSLATVDLNKLYQVSLQREPRDSAKGPSDGNSNKKDGKTFGNVMSKMKKEVRRTTSQVITELERQDPH